MFVLKGDLIMWSKGDSLKGTLGAGAPKISDPGGGGGRGLVLCPLSYPALDPLGAYDGPKIPRSAFVSPKQQNLATVLALLYEIAETMVP